MDDAARGMDGKNFPGRPMSKDRSSIKKGKKTMVVPTLVMAALALTLLALGIWRGQGEHVAGARAAGIMILEVLPMLIFAFFVAGMVQELLPHALIARWVGTESGFRGILIGTLAGGLTPGGPYVSLPLVAGLIKSGAGVGTVVAFLTGWSLIAVSRLPLEIGILGVRLTVIRMATTFFLAPVAGLLANLLFKGVKLQ